MQEIWKDIEGYEGLYQVCNTGLIKNISIEPNRILYGCFHIRGYTRVGLVKGNIVLYFLVHRIVAIHFIPNPNNLPLVCHRKEDLINGRLYNGEDNLFWGTHKDNAQDMVSKGRDNGLFKTNHPRSNKGVFGSMNHSSKKVIQYDLLCVFIKEWGSVIDASIALNIGKGGIAACCRGELKTSGGFIWKYS